MDILHKYTVIWTLHLYSVIEEHTLSWSVDSFSAEKLRLSAALGTHRETKIIIILWFDNIGLERFVFEPLVLCVPDVRHKPELYLRREVNCGTGILQERRAQ